MTHMGIRPIDTESDEFQTMLFYWQDSLPALQTAVYVMCGGGWLGDTAAHNPSLFYIGNRTGSLPYSNKAIMQAVGVLIAIAKAEGLDPYNLPTRPRFHNCGVF